MKFYETNFDEYLESLNKHNIHPELVETVGRFPSCISNMCNQIVYGPPGSGKYTQALKILEKYSTIRYHIDMYLFSRKDIKIYCS